MLEHFGLVVRPGTSRSQYLCRGLLSHVYLCLPGQLWANQLHPGTHNSKETVEVLPTKDSNSDVILRRSISDWMSNRQSTFHRGSTRVDPSCLEITAAKTLAVNHAIKELQLDIYLEDESTAVPMEHLIPSGKEKVSSPMEWPSVTSTEHGKLWQLQTFNLWHGEQSTRVRAKKTLKPIIRIGSQMALAEKTEVYHYQLGIQIRLGLESYYLLGGK